MFDFQDLDLSLLQVLATIVKLVTTYLDRGSDPDETEIEPNP